MFAQFRKFLLQTNALALAVGVIIGAAIGKVVGSLVSDVLMPVIGLGIPGGSWREAKIVLASNPDGTPRSAIAAGQFLGNIIDFVIIAAAVFLITKMLIKPEPPASPLKDCPECTEKIPLGARRCKYCTAPVPA
jgi:large conductance mechanosensitive channel